MVDEKSPSNFISYLNSSLASKIRVIELASELLRTPSVVAAGVSDSAVAHGLLQDFVNTPEGTAVYYPVSNGIKLPLDAF